MRTSNHWKEEQVKGKVLIVGIDIGKESHFAVMRVVDGMMENGFRFSNDRGGFERLHAAVEQARAEHGLEKVVVGLEPTGHYWEAFGYWWEAQHDAVVLVNPMHTRRAKEMEDNSPLKSDPKDARVIAGLVAMGKYLRSHLARGVFAELRCLVRSRRRCREHYKRVCNQLHQTVGRLFPELERAFSKLTVNSCVRLLATTPEPSQVGALSEKELSQRLRKWSRGRVGEQRAKQLRELAEQSVGVKEGAAMLGQEVKRLVTEFEAIEQQRRELERQIRQRLAGTPGARLLLTIPGFGAVTVATILAQTGDLRQYDSPMEVIKLAGLNLYEISSGQHRGNRRISKRGQAPLRQITYMAALRAAKMKGPLGDSYRAMVSRGVVKIKAVVALMRKLLRVSWSVVVHEQEFDAARLSQAQQLAKAA